MPNKIPSPLEPGHLNLFSPGSQLLVLTCLHPNVKNAPEMFTFDDLNLTHAEGIRRSSTCSDLLEFRLKGRSDRRRLFLYIWGHQELEELATQLTFR